VKRMVSHKAKYGLKALLSLAADVEARPVMVADLARRERLPRKFLEQILLELKHRGLLQSRRGKGGGYLLTRPPAKVSVGEVLRALDGPLAPTPCTSESAYVKCDECDDETTCGIHMLMKEVRDATAHILDSTSLADVVQSMAAARAVQRAATHVTMPERAAALKRPERAVSFMPTRRKA
jgi:Rrf2 family protein